MKIDTKKILLLLVTIIIGTISFGITFLFIFFQVCLVVIIIKAISSSNFSNKSKH